MKVDGSEVESNVLWWPAMNFNQFRWEARIGRYELNLPRTEFVKRLSRAYENCKRELQEDDFFCDDEDRCPLREADYPPLDKILDNDETRLELVQCYIYEDVFASFLPHPPAPTAGFMINSVEEVSATAEMVVVIGRGYHGGPGLANSDT